MPWPPSLPRSWLFIFCDRVGRALVVVAERLVEECCAAGGIGPGTSLREESCGTNAVALAMRIGRRVVIRGSDHYCALFEDWSCIAAPVTLPDGEVAGYLDLSLHHEEGLRYAAAIFELTLGLLKKELVAAPTPATPTVSNDSPKRMLTARQKEALVLYGTGLSLAEIAVRMMIGEDAVKKHLQEARARLGTENNRAAYYEAVRRGILPPPGWDRLTTQ